MSAVVIVRNASATDGTRVFVSQFRGFNVFSSTTESHGATHFEHDRAVDMIHGGWWHGLAPAIVPVGRLSRAAA